MSTKPPHAVDDKGQDPAALNTFGFTAHPGSLGEYLALVSRHIRDKTPVSVFYHNQHTIYGYFTNEKLRQCYRRSIVMADGMCVILLCKLSGYSVTRAQRLTYVDFIMPLLQLANSRGWRVFHVGQEANVLDDALETIRERIPGIEIDGHDGYFNQTTNSVETHSVISKINAHSTDLLLVGFGTPHQEFWVDAHREKINAPVVLTCGACMEYVAGAVRTPPRWMGRVGLEWSFRMMENPRRFAHRYTVQTAKLGLILCSNWFRSRLADSGKA